MGRAITSNSLTPPDGPLFSVPLALIIVLLLTVSPLGLIELGWSYSEAGGSPIEKFHPATLIAFALLLASATMRGNPISAIWATLADHPGMIVYLAGILMLMAHAVLVAGLPFTTFIDTFALPAVIYLLLRDLPEDRRLPLAHLVHVLFAINTIVGLSEFLFGFRITPLHIEGEVLEQEWRSSALLGHPLANALLTGCYMIMLLKGGDDDLSKPMRALALILAVGGMVVFGGRAATALLVLVILYIGAMRFGRVLLGERFDTRTVIISLLLVPFAGLLLIVLHSAGFFDQFVGRFVDDEGSASTRVEMFELFRYINWYDLLLGPDPRQITTLMNQYGLLYGIESFWIAMMLLHGLIVSFMFFAALFFFCREVVLSANTGAFLVFVYFFAVASTSLSLSAKSPTFAIMVLLTYLLGHRAGAAPLSVPTVPRMALSVA
jgi:hypothetical protein